MSTSTPSKQPALSSLYGEPDSSYPSRVSLIDALHEMGMTSARMIKSAGWYCDVDVDVFVNPDDERPEKRQTDVFVDTLAGVIDDHGSWDFDGYLLVLDAEDRRRLIEIAKMVTRIGFGDIV